MPVTLNANINENSRHNTKQNNCLIGTNSHCIQLLEVSKLYQHCNQVKKLYLAERKTYKRLKQTNKKRKQELLCQDFSNQINTVKNTDINSDLNKYIDDLDQVCQRLSFQLDVALRRVKSTQITPASSRHYKAPIFYCIDDATLEFRIAKASENKKDNCGLFHNLETPYTRPSWAPALIENVYKPSLALAQERQAIYQAEDKEDYSPALHVVSSIADFSLDFEPEVDYWECEWVLIIIKESNFDRVNVDENLFQQRKPHQNNTVKTVRFNPITQCLPHLAGEIIIISKKISNASNNIIKGASSSAQSLESVLKPISEPQINDYGNFHSEPIVISRSSFNARYFKNIPRLIEFADLAESKLGIRMDVPTGY